MGADVGDFFFSLSFVRLAAVIILPFSGRYSCRISYAFGTGAEGPPTPKWGRGVVGTHVRCSH